MSSAGRQKEMDAHAFLRGNPKNIAHGRVYYVPRSESKIHSLAKLNPKKKDALLFQHGSICLDITIIDEFVH